MLAVHNLPVYIDVHGGGFVYGYKELNRNFCIALARRGFAVISISYRVLPTSRFPRTIAGRERGHRLVAESCG